MNNICSESQYLYLYPVIAYFIGSIPFGLILSKIFGKSDPRTSGSKNIGATNVFRTQGKWLGRFTFLLDFAKGAAACYLLQTENEIVNLIIIAAPVIGHMFPIELKFKGGKGIATYFGVLCSLDAITFCLTAFVWVAVFFASKISSISGLASTISSCVIFCCVKYTNNLDFINQLCVLIALVIIIVAKHRENIRRLLRSNELKI
jgi:glycerol-3-phosphate acyltransferase PlsY